MHIPDGILPAQVCVGGYAIAGGVTWYVLRRIRQVSNPTEEIPKAAMLAAAFFIGSSINIPVPPVSIHLVLNGPLGVVLGWYAWPAILIGLFLQAVLIGHGGLTTLGVNAVMMGIPALIGFQVFKLRHQVGKGWSMTQSVGVFAFLAGAIALGLAALIFFGLIVFTIPAELNVLEERSALTALMIAHIPLMFIEGIFTLMLALFLLRVKPNLLDNPG
ncbi:MAG: cobalt transporter CbiM [Leptolyngbyaceae cyanobacterium T60_A2020_046]|nr:cobalt transporter CbiM [Leptolyngbyaceae cyanobacterium T60_A2020_046]